MEPFRKWVDMKVDSKERELDSFIMCLSDQIDRISQWLGCERKVRFRVLSSAVTWYLYTR